MATIQTKKNLFFALKVAKFGGSNYKQYLNNSYNIKRVIFNASISGGIAAYPDDAGKLLPLEDKAMYEAQKPNHSGFICANKL
jgi:GGDEF domain-containing protein